MLLYTWTHFRSFPQPQSMKRDEQKRMTNTCPGCWQQARGGYRECKLLVQRLRKSCLFVIASSNARETRLVTHTHTLSLSLSLSHREVFSHTPGMTRPDGSGCVLATDAKKWPCKRACMHAPGNGLEAAWPSPVRRLATFPLPCLYIVVFEVGLEVGRLHLISTARVQRLR